EVMAILRRKFPPAAGPAPMEDLAGNLAHELNQPLTAMALTARACVRLAKSEKQHSRELLQAIESLASQAERAGELVRRMRQLLSGGLPRRSAADLNGLVRDALAQFQSNIENDQIEVHLQLSDGLPPLSIDPIQISQVVVNLVRNAIEAMQETP